VAASSIMAVYLEQYMSGFIITAVNALFLLIFGEVIPKSLARERATKFTLHLSFFLRGFYILLYPVNWVVMRISRLFLTVLGLKGENITGFFTREDLDMLVHESEQAGLVNVEERELISRFILRGSQKVREIMIPRTEMHTVKLKETMKNVIEVFEKTGYSRLPVTGKGIDEILGMITAKDILLEKPSRVKEVLRDVLFVPETQVVAHLLEQMQEERVGIAIVVDEYGGTAGLITLEDIIEEFFGEIHDEFDEDVSLYRKIGPRQIDVKARVPVAELNEKFDLKLPEGDYQTLGGLLMERLGRIPKQGERVMIENCILVVLSAFQKKVSWVRIIRKENGGPSVNQGSLRP